ncbi:glycosyltransferase family 4 protein [Marinomonas sp.]|uniref:glycosyltransferase family 4 protein n=1 Tax=Marinomonas sp. TaxID=1904862 RepID=UPI003A935377
MHNNEYSKAIVVGVEPISLINFRGALIKDMMKSGKEILTVSLPLTNALQEQFDEVGISHQSIYFQRTGLNPVEDFKSLIALLGLFKKERPDFILAYTIKPVIWGGIAARFSKVPFYALVTGLGFAFQGESFRRKLLTKLVSFLYGVALSHANKVIFQNEDNRRLFVERRIVPFDKTEVVNGSGVDISRFDLSTLHSLDNGVRFLCIARLLGEKGLREYARAAAIVKMQYPNSQFVLVGPEDTSPDGILISEVKSWDGIDYQDSTNDVRPFIGKAHVYVLPSYHEGLPRSTIEAMSMGRAVITTDAVGCKDTVDEGVNGFKIPVKNVALLVEKMIWFIEHPDQIQPMGLASRKMVEEKFDVHKVNARMLEIMGL